ncbi:hypothetical protein OG453_38000 [Streptomyces sp. NBC_01381]|uniref:hypothetical protein n=1 Tax=Streptomyces sp. NBC_01381 TaxID=2903845 RepID=UPI002251C286|nr:hypothetical protein [Streptomyces sp. NBC_01381]MCX4672390.1 hypothetical protein [Streptomyces sp. NBC_01381]
MPTIRLGDYLTAPTDRQLAGTLYEQLEQAELTDFLAAWDDCGCVGDNGLWSTSCGRVRRVTVDLRVMPVEFARKSPGWTVVWSTVLRRERSAATAG